MKQADLHGAYIGLEAGEDNPASLVVLKHDPQDDVHKPVQVEIILDSTRTILKKTQYCVFPFLYFK